MKYVFSIIFLYFLIISKSTADDIIHFPDSAFKNYLLTYFSWDFVIDSNNDGEIQNSEAEAITTQLIISPDFANITDITGIKAFKNVSNLVIANNKNLAEVDLSGMQKLKWLNIVQNPKLNYLNISNCPELFDFIGYDNALIKIDVSKCPKLYSCSLSNNQLLNLILNDCNNLEFLYCKNNKIKMLSIDDSSPIVIIRCSNNHLSQFDVSDKSKIKGLDISSNNLITLDISDAHSLENLNLDSNNLESLNIRNGDNQKITKFSTLGNPNLKCITVDDEEYSHQNWKNIDPWTDFSEDCITDVKDSDVPNFRIYPNPADNEIIYERYDTEPQKLKIIDIAGNIVYTYDLKQDQPILIIDISAYPKGIYFIESGNEILVRDKFVVE